jgi:hypothetical protein
MGEAALEDNHEVLPPDTGAKGAAE